MAFTVRKAIKVMQTDNEEAKAQEISKLQISLKEMKTKAGEACTTLLKEWEAAKNAIEEAPLLPVVRETQTLLLL